MSGGVDSSVTAALMLDKGYDCTGVNMRLFSDAEAARCSKSCCSLADARDAAQVADALGMPFYVLHYTEEFRRYVVDKFVRSYVNGITPNPCIDCNRYLKFDLLLENAKAHGCEKIATGHYAQIVQNPETGRYELHKAADPDRDQSYVLYMLSQEQLAHISFPLGGMLKRDVRKIASDYGFENAKKPDSQDICFVPRGHYGDFIASYLGQTLPAGNFVDENGQVLGTHKGVHCYTVGQRKGLHISSDAPWYVKELRIKENEVVLSREDALFQRTLTATQFSWLSVEAPTKPIRAKAKIRYRHTEQDALITPLEDGNVRVVFDTPQRAITKGQALVLYDGECVLGGGTIAEAGGS